jgi:ankyrin repeat protein
MEPSYSRVLEVLLKSGASVNARDKNGITPLGDEVSKCRESGYHAEILRRYGGTE